jgi:hypothetical protein
MPTSAAQVEAAILALRADKKLLGASEDSVYRAAAQAGADAFANGDDESDISKAVQSALAREVQRRRQSRPGACIFSLELLEPSQLNQISSLSLPGLRRFGVGARVRRDQKGTRLATVLMLEGVPCAAVE